MTSRVLITGARAPAALHLARLLHGAGHHVLMADSLRWPVGAASNACATYLRLPAANGPLDTYADAIADALQAHQIDLVIPTCEEVFYLARIWGQRQMPAPLFAPSFDTLATAHNKYAFVQLAASMGLNVPQTWELTCHRDLEALPVPADQLVFKPVWSRFATRVSLRPAKPICQPTPADPWVAQRFVAGKEVCAYAIAYQGHLVAVSAYRPTYRAGKGAGIVFVPDQDPAIADFIRRFVAVTAWNGQLSFDFIRQADGTITAIECNPRATSGIHFFGQAEGFANGLLRGQACAPDVTDCLGVKAALALYGPLQHPFRVWRGMARMGDVMTWPGDMGPVWRQVLATLELGAVALRHRISLTAATTHDIAWDGDQSA
ncbi:MAG: hypothetical protein AAFN63_07385 [Pseudomonadota bacterium]